MKAKITKSLKIAIAAILAIALAGELGLKYSPTAGIITVLSIQNTKRETFKSARNRGLAFGCAIILAAICYGAFGFTLWAFALYLFLFALLCLWRSWGEAIAMDSVLITHFLAEESMSSQLLVNELLLFVIGTGFGILINLHLKKKGSEFERFAGDVDEAIKGIFRKLSQCLSAETDTDSKSLHGTLDKMEPDFMQLEKALKVAKTCAATNYNNDLIEQDTFEMDYIRMREQQSVILRGIYDNISRIDYLPIQARQVGDLFAKIEQEFHKDNTVKGLLDRLQELFQDMERQELPVNRKEFEARAILFYILMQTRSLLELKRNFVCLKESLRKKV